jgi:hypothetical protein
MARRGDKDGCDHHALYDRRCTCAHLQMTLVCLRNRHLRQLAVRLRVERVDVTDAADKRARVEAAGACAAAGARSEHRAGGHAMAAQRSGGVEARARLPTRALLRRGAHATRLHAGAAVAATAVAAAGGSRARK